jgi:pyridoxal 5'-phosphate synthase pdxT subunit
MNIGVLALQGAFIEHIAVLRSLNVDTTPIRLPEQLGSIDALVIPGGESTTISKLLLDYKLFEPIKMLVKNDFPVFGTCAGMVLLSGVARNNSVSTLGLVDIEIDRNAYGRQVDSFVADLQIPAIGKEPFRGIFIRAPIIHSVGNNVKILCSYRSQPVAVCQNKILACSFHPELSGDNRIHKYFIGLARGEIVEEYSK